MSSKLLGSILIVTGTVVGAGMLAIPIVTGSLGFLASTLLLFSCWAVMLIAAFLILHVNLAFKEKANFNTMAIQTIGRSGQVLTWLSFLLLLYALTAAYMTGGAALLGNTLSLFKISVSDHISAFLFTLVLGTFVYFGTRVVDYANRLLISLKATAFLLMIIFLFPHVHVQNLLMHEGSDQHLAWLAALPILITSFGFHTVIPNLRDYLHSDVTKLKRVLLIGSSIPLVIYLLWEIVILGVIPSLDPSMGLPDMINMLSAALDRPVLGFIVNFFTDVAITTSFLGVTLGLFHFVRDGFHLNHNRKGERAIAALITFLPPLCFAWFYPKGFVMALSYASIFLVVLFNIIPVWMYLCLKKQGKKSTYPFSLHGIGVAFLLLFSVVVIGAQFLSQ